MRHLEIRPSLVAIPRLQELRHPLRHPRVVIRRREARLAVLPVSWKPARLMPIDDGEDSDWTHAIWSDDDVGAVEIAVGEGDGDVVGERLPVGVWRGRGGGASAAAVEIVVEGGDGGEGPRGVACVGKEDV